MAQLNEVRIIQNEAVGVLLLWAFVHEFHVATSRANGPTLPILMPVLPMAFHRPTVEAISSKTFQGGLFRALAEDPTIVSGLQARMESMADQTFKALNLGFAAEFIGFEREAMQVVPRRRGLPREIETSRIQEMLATARRLGQWCASLGFEQLCIALRLSF